jgi:cytoplasmic iron level regulating protein YaaA (DUF328/UPF0246 family)
MIVLISPAKTLDFDSPPSTKKESEPRFLNDSARLINGLRQLSAPEISSLMKLSDKLGELNHHRYQTWQPTPSTDNVRQAILAFKGDVYLGLQAETFNTADFTFAQKQLRILSGLYGLLRPLDNIQAYRLEMGIVFKTEAAKNLYEFWGDKLSQQLQQDIQSNKSKAVINLASNEYAKVVDFNQLDVPTISPVFKDSKNGELKIISFFAKKARGMMSAFIIKNRLQNPDDILAFEEGGYYYNPALSTPQSPVFVR